MCRISEDEVLLGFVIAVSVWLFVGLPLLYSPDTTGTAMASPSLLTLLIGFFGGSVASWILGTIFNWCKRPIISARLVQGKGCYVTTSRGNPRTHDARFLRLLVENTGRSSIQNCKGYITSITRIVNGNRSPVQQEVLELEWSSGGAASARSIPQGAFFYMNIASLELVQPGPFVLLLAVGWTPNHLAHLLQGAATFELEIKIAAENAAPLDRIVRFEFDPQQQDIRFQFD
jgi:hypothetical protein